MRPFLILETLRLELQQPFWLPIQQRTQQATEQRSLRIRLCRQPVPPYIDELLQRQVRTRSLRSTDAPRLPVPWTRTETAKRVFCVAAPNVRNSLLNDIRNASSLSTFRAKLKTHCWVLVMNIPTSAPLYSHLVDIIGAMTNHFTLDYISVENTTVCSRF